MVYGPASQAYAWSSSALTTAEIYTFPSSFTTSGLVHHLTSRPLTLTFSGGDGLHSSVVASQIEYVKYTQGAAETTVAASGLSCSASAGTVQIVSIAPALLADVTLKVALRAPDGAVGPELTRTIASSSIAPQWVPTAAGSMASNIPSPNRLVVGSEAQLTFSFVSGADFPSSDATSLFALSVAGVVTSLAGAVVSASARTVRVAYTAATNAAVSFEFSTSYGTSYTFSVSAAEVYTFPTMSSTSRGVSVVTLGQTLALTSSFSATLPASLTAAVSVVPAGYAAVSPAASVSGATVTYAMSVAYDVVHTATVTLTYGAAQRQYSWAAGTMTAAHIYTFPSSFTYSGTANGFGTGIHLKESTAGALTLTFSGGDLLHSSVVSTQVEYVKFAQSGADTTIPAASVACSDPLETVSISSLTPSSTADLTLKVKLRGPDGALSSEITAVVPSAQIVALVVIPLFTVGGVTITADPASTYSLFSYSTTGGMTAPGGAVLTVNTATNIGWRLPQGFPGGGTSSWCMRLMLDTSLRPYESGWIFRSNSEDPSVYFDVNNGLYIGENWGGRFSPFLPISSAQWTGTIRILILGDQTGSNGLISAVGPGISSVVAMRPNAWMTFGDGQGGNSTGAGTGVSLLLHKAVVQADFWWKTHGQQPPLSSPSNVIRLPDNWQPS